MRNQKDRWIIEKFTGGQYEVTTDGILISHNAYHGRDARVLKTHINSKTGYEQVSIWNKEERRCVSILVHRIVALVHLPNPEALPQVNHIDGNKLNNATRNLEWCSAGDNDRHAYETGLRSASGESNGQAKLTEVEVLEIRKLREGGDTYREIGEKFGIHTSTARGICSREYWSHV